MDVQRHVPAVPRRMAQDAVSAVGGLSRVCNAPSLSSHLVELLSPILRRTQVSQRLRRPALVVPTNPPMDCVRRMGERLKSMSDLWVAARLGDAVPPRGPAGEPQGGVSGIENQGVVRAPHQWIEEYNTERPHDSLGDLTSEEYLVKTQKLENSTLELSA